MTSSASGLSSAPSSELPTAVIRRERRFSFAWILPVGALVFAAWLGYSAWVERGVAITIRFDRGHGLKIDDPVRYRGTMVGVVSDVAVSPDLGNVLVRVRLHPETEMLARAGSRFWVERPRFGLDGVGGLDTIVGPRYIAVSPGDGDARRLFIGMEHPPVVETRRAGDLELVLEMSRRYGLSAGAPVSYRGVRVGTVLDVALATDGGSVEAKAHIERPYARLIREQTRFFVASGVAFSAGWQGLSIEVDSLQTALAGGISLATPPDGGDAVGGGHRFTLHPEPDESWLQWNPQVPIGAELAPMGLALPDAARATIGWTQGWFGSTRSQQGWVLPTDHGVIGPENILRPNLKAKKQSVVLQIDGVSIHAGAPKANRDGVMILDGSVREHPWPSARLRAANGVEDCIVIGDPSMPPYPLSASRLSVDDGRWLIDRALHLDPDLHGAAVMAQRDGAVVGILLVGEERWTVALLNDVLASLPDTEP